MASGLQPIFVDGRRVALRGAERPDVQKVLESCGVDTGTVDVWRLDGPDDGEGDLLGRADVLDRKAAQEPIFLRLQKSRGSTPAPEEGVGLGTSPGAGPATPTRPAATSPEVPEGPGSTRNEPLAAAAALTLPGAAPFEAPGTGPGKATASYAASGQPAEQRFGRGIQENPLGGEQPSRLAGRRRGRGDPMQLPRPGRAGRRPRPPGQGHLPGSPGSADLAPEREWTAGLPGPRPGLPPSPRAPPGGGGAAGGEAQRKDASSRRDRPATSHSSRLPSSPSPHAGRKVDVKAPRPARDP